MIKFEDYRKDKEFKIDSLAYPEIFGSLKGGIEKAICKFEQIEELDDLFYPNLDSRVEMKYGKDKDMYPSVIFMIAAKTGKRWGIDKFL